MVSLLKECLVILLAVLSVVQADKLSLKPYTRDAVAYEDGTTVNFEDIFNGRCYEFGCLSCLGEKPLTCDTIFSSFLDGVLSDPVCALEDTAYDSFLQLVAPDLPVDTTTFWSGTYEIAHQLSATSGLYYTMEDTFMGYLVNSLNWCGNDDQTDFDYEDCRAWDYDDCYGQATSVFWNKASALMAAQARGSVTVILNGDATTGAFRNSSFFARVEAPNLNPEKVYLVNVLLIHDLDGTPFETCDDPQTLQYLEALLKEMGIAYSCQDDPDNARFLQCSQEPEHPECSSCTKGFLDSIFGSWF
ncbi:putative ADP-ribosyl cyclase/cyclic ADP-ribose hydrolase 1 isoform X1 [Apostichopus japonicus]|uniref:Putative ADP-ribosyl cyclase/cyclic ADP-ribose hydrolase 1 isoform X1 n=1 Tax=Stichopus japonicus TaxID=307972 RepID=A0A2G8LH35_STIJA|nr:putative ADP-ribosyl cyclase/cyclic ADP-ribose hydrolase 1 isoform X1 [Apostichopus japonicus]